MLKKVVFLIDKSNDWILPIIKKQKFNFRKKYIFKISKNYKTVKNNDIVFIINYTRILDKKFLNNNKRNIVIHASKLPKDKGFAPMQNQILRGKNKIFFSLIEAAESVDSGKIYFSSKIKLKGHELNEELRNLQAREIINLIEKFLKRYPNVIGKKQSGLSTFNKKRTPKDSKININKSIKSQFNLIRIADNNRYPLFFKHKKFKYILKVYKHYK